MKNPDENENEVNPIDEEAREFVEQLPGYQDYLDECRGDALNYGDV